jgi:hypothetical protein
VGGDEPPHAGRSGQGVGWRGEVGDGGAEECEQDPAVTVRMRKQFYRGHPPNIKRQLTYFSKNSWKLNSIYLLAFGSEF